MNSLVDISKVILNSKKIGITYHVSPDGDAVGSALALLNGLKYLNKDAYLISKDIISDNLQFLKSSSEGNGLITSPSCDTDTVVVVDCGNFERISAELKNFKGTIINIDHHLSNNKYGKINEELSDPLIVKYFELNNKYHFKVNMECADVLRGELLNKVWLG